MTAPKGAPAAPDWRALLDRLDAARARSFATADAAALLQVYSADGPLLAADQAAVQRLESARQTARGVRHSIRSVTVSAYDERSATLRVVDVLAAYDVVDASGRVVQHATARPAAVYVVTLKRTAGGWRLQQVVPG